MDGGDMWGELNLPPGFRFHPTDEELVVFYLKQRLASASCPLPLSIIAEIDLYKYNPWDLPGLAKFGEHEWYFFSPRDRKYPNGARPNRAASSGYWKATGTDKPVLTTSCPSSSSSHSSSSSRKVGVKKALVFYKGKPPKGVKTNWIMHEYRLTDPPLPLSIPPPSSRPHSFVPRKSLRLDDWVLCRIYKKAHAPRQEPEEEPHVPMMAMDIATLPHLGSSSLATWLVENNIAPQICPHLDTIQPQHALPFTTTTTPNMVSSMSPYIPKLLENEEEPELFQYNTTLAPSRRGPCANVVDDDGSSPFKRGFPGSRHNTHLSMTTTPPSTPNQPSGDIHTNTLQWPFLEDKYRYRI